MTEKRFIERGAAVVGIERDPGAAAQARSNGLEVLEHDLDDPPALSPELLFDCLLFADVLEHLRSPDAVLAHFLPHLVKDGTIVVSVPNFRHYSFIWSLAYRGEITYSDAGILDRTHIRITTLRMVQSWFRTLGIKEEGHRYVMHKRRERYISRALFGLADDLLASQVVIVGAWPGN